MADQRFRSQQRDPGLSQASTPGAKGRFSQRGEDPLAELARLIGQDDPFADFRDDPRRPPQSSANGYAPRNGIGRDRHSEEDQDYDEIAAITGLTKTNVSVRLVRIRRALKEYVERNQ